MALDTASLEPLIYRILTAPGTDLSTISAKRVRRQLVEEETLTAEYVKEQREAIDALITRVFERVNAEQQQGEEEEEEEYEDDSGGEESHTSRKRQHSDNDEDDEEGDRGSPPPTKKAKKSSSQNGKKLSDEALARKLSNEINGRTTRTGKAGGTKARGSSKAKARKSAATIDSDDDSDNGAATKKKPKKRASSSTGGGGARGGFAKEFVLSGALATVVQAEKMSRPQVVKQLWVYIKENELQNPRDKREIICDTNLKAVFGKEKVSMFGMNKILGQHLHEPEA
ncbi:hypothetical protein BKA70DRAFT_1181698 [Coprinopsis sp. MPI-PUGE-AT-0042]|nr:hypothetical protein BKA70DRAFT_1181698 [Coprinopsis sp. MPI-PUGE-AT-0042]